jgi:hypothetical protein
MRASQWAVLRTGWDALSVSPPLTPLHTQEEQEAGGGGT